MQTKEAQENNENLDENTIIAKVVNAGKEYIVGDTTITALKASTVDLKASGQLIILWK